MIQNSKFKIQNSRRGFTLIEIMVAIFLIGVALVGVLAFFNSSLTSNFDAKNELIAAGLAQEGTELVRNIVDHSYLNDPTNWYTEIINKKADENSTLYCSSIDRDVLVGGSFKCKSNPKKGTLVCFDVADGFYYQANNEGNCPGEEKTEFKRQLAISGYNLDGLDDIDLETKGDCLNVVATVGWPKSNSACNSNIQNCPYKTVSTDIICKPRQ